LTAPAVALVLGAAGVLYRFVLTALDAPPTNSDEGTMGLAAFHIIDGRGFPAFFYGQHYMGTLEAYAAVPLLAVAGPSVFALRIPALLCYAAFLWLMYRLAGRLYTPWLAAATVGLLALGSDRVLKNQLIAAGGYPEINPAGAALVLLAVGLALGGGRRRLVAFAGWGLVAGLMLWDDWLLLPYLATAAVLLLVFCRHEVNGRAGAVLGAALVVGAAPLIWYNITATAGQNSIRVFLDQSHGGSAPVGVRFYNGVLFGLPMGTGLCAPASCGRAPLAWGVAVPVLLAVAGWLAFRALRATRDRSVRVVQAGRLALVVAGALSLLSYAQSSAAVHHPIESSRYLSCLLISLPAVLWPLWTVASRVREGGWRTAFGGAAATAVAGLAVAMVAASAALVAHVPVYRAEARNTKALIEALDRLGITRMYADYWTCDKIVFLTRERVVCAVLGDDGSPGQDRYPPYRAIVTAADHPAAVFPIGSPAQRSYAAGPGGRPGLVLDVAGYRIYRSAG
jgi:hypothetical protein